MKNNNERNNRKKNNNKKVRINHESQNLPNPTKKQTKHQMCNTLFDVLLSSLNVFNDHWLYLCRLVQILI